VNTLCRAFDELMKPAMVNSMLDLMVKMAEASKLIKRRKGKPLTLDSTMFESRHISRHFERRRRDTNGKKARVPGAKAPIAAEV